MGKSRRSPSRHASTKHEKLGDPVHVVVTDRRVPRRGPDEVWCVRRPKRDHVWERPVPTPIVGHIVSAGDNQPEINDAPSYLLYLMGEYGWVEILRRRPRR